MSDQKIEIGDKINEITGDGFDTLVNFHRLGGILYIGYGKYTTKWRQICIILWGVLVWSWVTIANTPCLLACYMVEYKETHLTSFYLFNVMFITSTIANIFCSIVISIRGHRFQVLIEDLNKSVVNKHCLRTLKLIVILFIIISTISVLMKFAILMSDDYLSFVHIIRGFEDLFSEIMSDQTGILLIYLSHYISIIIAELNEYIEKSFELEINDIDFDYLYEKITKIQKLIKRANSLLSPCLIITFMFNLFFLMFIAFFIQHSPLTESKFNLKNFWPLIFIFVVRIFIWCLFVDKMNEKVCFKHFIQF